MDLDRLREMLTKHEGLRLKMYKCTAGKWTIGIGHNIEDKGISEDVAQRMFEEDIAEVIEDITKVIPEFYDLPERIQLVVCDMRFQLGAGGFRSFKNTIKKIRSRDWEGMINGMRASLWYKQTTNRVNDLIALVREEMVG